MNKPKPKVKFYFRRADKWKKELARLRAIVLDCGLTEELKWGCPCYTIDDNNIVLIHSFRDYCALLFFNGALLKDTHDLLVQQTKNVQAARQIRFDSVEEIDELESVVKTYIQEAIEVERAGLKVILKKTAEFDMPEELQLRLDEDPAFRTAFEALTPGRQRGYILHIGAAKQAKTRESRIEKYRPQILEGKGLNDQ